MIVRPSPGHSLDPASPMVEGSWQSYETDKTSSLVWPVPEELVLVLVFVSVKVGDLMTAASSEGVFLPHRPARVVCFGLGAATLATAATRVDVVEFSSPEFLTRTIVPEYPNLVVEQFQNEV